MHNDCDIEIEKWFAAAAQPKSADFVTVVQGRLGRERFRSRIMRWSVYVVLSVTCMFTAPTIASLLLWFANAVIGLSDGVFAALGSAFGLTCAAFGVQRLVRAVLS